MSRRARWSVSTVFFVNGMTLASWVPHIPAVKARHGLDDGTLGLVLVWMALGAMVALPLAGGLVARFGSRRMTTVGALALCLALPGPILSPGVAWLDLSLLLLGAANGTLDVSMNAQAVVVERGYGRAIMSSFHALFSLGGLVGAALAGGALALGVPPTVHVLAIAAVATGLVVAALPGLVPSPPQPATVPALARPTGVLLGLGVLAFCGLLAEGAMADWSAVYLRDALGSSPGLAAAGFAAFSLAMAGGRSGGDRLVGLLGPAGVLRLSGLVAALGLGGALVIGAPLAGIAGCGLMGLGIANIIPVLFSGAGRVPGVAAGTALGAVATTGYLGLLAGPPLIGLTARATSLPVALGLVSLACALVACGGALVADGDAVAPAPRLRGEVAS